MHKRNSMHFHKIYFLYFSYTHLIFMICQKRARQTRQHFVGRNHLLANFIAMAFQATHVRVCLKCNWNLVGKTNWNCCIMQKAIKPQTERPLQLGGWKWMVKRETTIDFNAIFYFSKIKTGNSELCFKFIKPKCLWIFYLSKHALFYKKHLKMYTFYI